MSAQPAPTKPCKECGQDVTAQYVPNGGVPWFAPLWRYRCEGCGHVEDEIADEASDKGAGLKSQ